MTVLDHYYYYPYFVLLSHASSLGNEHFQDSLRVPAILVLSGFRPQSKPSLGRFALSH